MQSALRPWITAGVALTGASVVAVTPVAPPQPDVQERSVQLTSGSSALFGDLTGGIQQALGTLSPDLGNISTSLSGGGDPLAGLFTGVDPGNYPTTGLAELIANTEGNLTGLEHIIGANPFPLLNAPDVTAGVQTVFTDLLHGQLSSPALNPISLLIEGGLLDFSPLYGPNAALNGLDGIANNIQGAESAGDYQAVLENFLLAPTTVANDFLNGYQPGTAGTPFTDLVSPEFGFLTNPQGSPEFATGTLDAFQMLQQTLADELSATGGSTATSTLPVLGPGTLDLSVALGPILSALGADQSLTVNALVGEIFPNGVGPLSLSALQTLLGTTGTENLATLIGPLLPNDLNIPVNIPALDTTVPTYDADLAHDLLAVVGSVGPLSSALPSLLTPDPSIDLVPVLSGLLTDLGLPVSIVSGQLPLDLTGVSADALNALISNGTLGGGLDLSGLLGGLDLGGLLGGTDLSGLLDVGGSGLTSLPLDIGSTLLSMF